MRKAHLWPTWCAFIHEVVYFFSFNNACVYRRRHWIRNANALNCCSTARFKRLMIARNAFTRKYKTYTRVLTHIIKTYYYCGWYCEVGGFILRVQTICIQNVTAIMMACWIYRPCAQSLELGCWGTETIIGSACVNLNHRIWILKISVCARKLRTDACIAIMQFVDDVNDVCFNDATTICWVSSFLVDEQLLSSGNRLSSIFSVAVKYICIYSLCIFVAWEPGQGDMTSHQTRRDSLCLCVFLSCQHRVMFMSKPKPRVLFQLVETNCMACIQTPIFTQTPNIRTQRLRMCKQ